jgi:protein pelota
VKVLARDRESGSVKLRIDSLDDLAHLRELVEQGDVATALTWRTADLPKADERSGKAEKRAVTLSVRVESVEYADFSNRLRLLGPIVEGAQDVGSYHTISVEPGTELTLRKPSRGFRAHHDERIREAVEATARPLVTLLAIEDNEAVVATLRQFGVVKNADVTGHASGKQYAATKGEEESFFDEILLALRDYRPEGSPLLVLGPGFAKERFLAYARGKQTDLVKGAMVEATGQAGMTAIHEALKRGTIDRVSKDQRVARETALVERFLEHVATDGLAAYGPAYVRRALDAGAVETLLVTDKLARTPEGEAFLDAARGTGAQAHVVSTLHEAGKRLHAMGAVGAILRYRLTE